MFSKDSKGISNKKQDCSQPFGSTDRKERHIFQEDALQWDGTVGGRKYRFQYQNRPDFESPERFERIDQEPCISETPVNTNDKRKVRTREPLIKLCEKPDEEPRNGDCLQNDVVPTEPPMRSYVPSWTSKSPMMLSRSRISCVDQKHLSSWSNRSSNNPDNNIFGQSSMFDQIQSIRPRRQISNVNDILHKPHNHRCQEEFKLTQDSDVLAFSNHFAVKEGLRAVDRPMKCPPIQPSPQENAKKQSPNPEEVLRRKSMFISVPKTVGIEQETSYPMPNGPPFIHEESQQVSSRIVSSEESKADSWQPLKSRNEHHFQDANPEVELDAHPSKKSNIFAFISNRLVPSKPVQLRYGRAAMVSANAEEVLARRYRSTDRRNEVCDSLDQFMEERMQTRVLAKRFGIVKKK